MEQDRRAALLVLCGSRERNGMEEPDDMSDMDDGMAPMDDMDDRAEL